MDFQTVIYIAVLAGMRVIQAINNKVSSNSIHNNRQLFLFVGYQNAVSALLGLGLLFFVGMQQLQMQTFVLATLMGLMLTANALANTEALKISICVFTSVIANAGGLVIPAVAGIFLFQQPMNLFQWLGVGIVLLGAYLTLPPSTQEEQRRFRRKDIRKTVLLSVIFFSNGMMPVIQTWFAVKTNGSVAMFTFVQFLTSAAATLLIGLRMKTVSAAGQPIRNPESKKLAVSGFLLALAVFVTSQLVTILTKTIPSAVLFPSLVAMTLLITALVGRVFFREKVTARIGLGLLICMIGVVLTNLK